MVDAYETGFLVKCAEMGVSRLRAGRLLRMAKSAGVGQFLSDHGAALAGAGLGAGAGWLFSREDDNGRRRHGVVNMLLGGLAGGVGGTVARHAYTKMFGRNVASANKDIGGGLSEDAPDIQSYLRGRNTDLVRKELGLRPNQPVTLRDVATYFAKTVPGVDPNELSFVPSRDNSKWDLGNTRNHDVYAYRLAHQVDLVNRLRAMGMSEQEVGAIAGMFAKATSKRGFDYRYTSGGRGTAIGLDDAGPIIDRERGQLMASLYGQGG